jgi:hypothetical protein
MTCYADSSGVGGLTHDHTISLVKLILVRALALALLPMLHFVHGCWAGSYRYSMPAAATLRQVICACWQHLLLLTLWAP